MTTLKFTFSLCLIISLLLFQVILGAGDSVFHSCLGSTHYKANDHFDKNLQNLMKHLSSYISPEGFSTGSFGEGENLAYGHALCGHDVSPQVCKECVTEASTVLRIRCRSSKNAIIWYTNCLLKYSDTDLFGQIDIRHTFQLFSLELVDEPNLFQHKLTKLMHQLAKEASENQIMYAVGKSKVDERKHILGSVLCAQDLQYSDCEKCLNHLIKMLPKPNKVNSGGHIVSGSCTLEFDTKFLERIKV